jgi:hypothetical protein
MNTIGFQITITHESFGKLLKETFVNPTQFKLFLKMIQGCLTEKQDLTFFNGQEFFIHVPYKHLKDSIITTQMEDYSMADHLLTKSKLEQQV